MKLFVFQAVAEWDTSHAVAIVARNQQEAEEIFVDVSGGDHNKNACHTVADYDLREGTVIHGHGYDYADLEVTEAMIVPDSGSR